MEQSQTGDIASKMPKPGLAARGCETDGEMQSQMGLCVHTKLAQRQYASDRVHAGTWKWLGLEQAASWGPVSKSVRSILLTVRKAG